MLSDVDLRRRLGKEILIYPFNSENIEGGSIFITSSKLAWSRTTKKTLLQNDGQTIIIPPNDTALIISEEVIYINNKHAATCHSRVKLVAVGLGHISTVIKPGCCSKLLISIHNHTKENQKIKVGEKISVVMFYKLRLAASKRFTTDNANLETLVDLEILPTPEERQELSLNICRSEQELRRLLTQSEKYQEYTKNSPLLFSWTNVSIGLFVFLIIVQFICLIPLPFFSIVTHIILKDIMLTTLPVTSSVALLIATLWQIKKKK